MNDLEALGARLRTAQEQALAERDDLAQARERLLAGTPTRRKPRAPFVIGAVTATFAAAAVLLFAFWPVRRPLAFQVGEAAGRAQTWIAARPDEDLPLRFSDGSSLLLRFAARARVTHTDEWGATVQLERGEAAVSVLHREHTRWTIQAGPYLVHVIGTRFDVGYQPDTKTFSLDLHDGSVRIDGPELRGRVLVAGQKVRLQAATATTVTAAPSEPHALRAPREASVVEETEMTPSPPPARASDTPVTNVRVPEAADWRALARRGQYERAVSVAQRSGVPQLLRGSALSDVLLFADSAYYARDDELAQRAYQAVRTRAPGQADASAAAFSLGRLSMRRADGARSAAQWFRTYLTEAPRGAFAREALGRLCEAERAAGDLAAARVAGKAYLERYPDGPHAPLVREILSVPMQ